MRCYNAVMSGKPFQFSMRRMLVFVTLFCVAAWFARFVLHTDPHSGWMTVIAMAAVFGAVVGGVVAIFARAPVISTMFVGAILAFATLGVTWQVMSFALWRLAASYSVFP
jgi:hypothetical protein